MVRFTLVAVIASWLVLVGPQPCIAGPLVKRDRLKDAQDSFRGIRWEEAWDECGGANPNDKRFDTLVEATRMALELAKRPLQDGDYTKSSAWNRFFLKTPRWDNTSNKYRLESLVSALTGASRFAREGKRNRKGQPWRGGQITYHCKPLDPPLNFCSDGTPAYTHPPEVMDAGYDVVFCPRFFKMKHLNDIAAGRAQMPSDLEALTSLEHAMVHEWFHCNVLGHKIAITDKESYELSRAPLQELKVYGAQNCHDYAWKDAFGSFLDINPNVIFNADNYAFFLTNYWFAKEWKWDWDDGKGFSDSGPTGGPRLPKREDSDQTRAKPITDGSELVYADHVVGEDSTEDSKDYGDSANCRQAGDHLICDYIGEAYDEFDKDRLDSFTTGGLCQLSKECWVSFGDHQIVDPACICKCNGEVTSLHDPKCAGFAGTIPDTPSEADRHPGAPP